MKVFVFCLLFSTIGVNAKNTSEISDNYIKVTYEDFLKNQFLHDCKGQNNREKLHVIMNMNCYLEQQFIIL